MSGNPTVGSGGIYPLTESSPNGLQQQFLLYVYDQPSITSPNSLNAIVGVQVSFQVNCPNYPPVTSYALQGTLPAGMDFDPTTGKFFGSPAPGTGGSYPMTIMATSKAGSTSQSFTINVSEAPKFTIPNNTTWTAGVKNSFVIGATGFPSPTKGASGLNPAAPWLGITQNGLAGNPPVSAVGPYTLTLSAFNSAGSVSMPFTLYVKANPTVTWNTPAPIQFGSALSATQLNATAAITGIGTVPGQFTYSPPLGTVLPPGKNLVTVTFVPTDLTKYFEATQEVFVTVNFAPSYPFEVAASTVLSRDSTGSVLATVTLANTGSATVDTVILATAQLGPLPPAVINPTTLTALNPGKTATIVLTFAPDVVGLLIGPPGTSTTFSFSAVCIQGGNLAGTLTNSVNAAVP